MASHALSTYSSRVFYLKTRRSEIAQTATGIPRRAIPTPPPRSLATARVASPRAPSASTSGDGDDEDPRVFTIGEDGEFVALDAARTSSEDRARDAPGDDDDWALDSAVEVIRGPDGDVLFRFTGDAEEHYNAAVAFASEEDARAEPEPEPEPTPAQRAQALLDEAQALIEEAKRIRAEDEVAVAAAAKRAAETIAPDTEGTRIIDARATSPPRDPTPPPSADSPPRPNSASNPSSTASRACSPTSGARRTRPRARACASPPHRRIHRGRNTPETRLPRLRSTRRLTPSPPTLPPPKPMPSSSTPTRRMRRWQRRWKRSTRNGKMPPRAR